MPNEYQEWEPHEPYEESKIPFGKKQRPEPQISLINRLHETLCKIPLDNIALQLLTITYGDMKDLEDGIRQAALGQLPESVNLADIMHKWASKWVLNNINGEVNDKTEV